MKLHITRRAVIAGIVLTLPACSSQAPDAASAELAGGPYDTHIPMQEFMGHVMQHAADGIWSRAGTIADENGERSLYPTDDEGWEQAESAALLLAETTNALLLPGRKVDDGQWLKSTEAVRAIALEAATAAENQDREAWWAAGEKLDPACETCHSVYLKEEEVRQQ